MGREVGSCLILQKSALSSRLLLCPANPWSEGSAGHGKSRLKALLWEDTDNSTGRVHFLAILILKKAEAKHTSGYPNNFSDSGRNLNKRA